MRNDQPNVPDLEGTAIKALAAASKTPFRTAFKVTMGVALARLAVTAIFLCGFIAVSTVVYLVTR